MEMKKVRLEMEGSLMGQPEEAQSSIEIGVRKQRENGRNND